MSTLLSQIDKFRDKTALCSSSFSLTTCANNITAIASSYRDITSIKSLQDFVNHSTVSTTRQKRDLVIYAQWLLDTFAYLRDLKSNFKSRIYQPLLQKSLASHHNSANLSQELQATAESIGQTLGYLDKLLDGEDEIDGGALRLDRQALVRRGIAESQQALVSLIPSALVHLDQLASLATQWLTAEAQARAEEHKKTIESQEDRSRLVGELAKLSGEIDAEEEELQKQSEQLHLLLEREERTNRINGENSSLELKMNGLTDKLQELRLEVEDVRQLMLTSKANESFQRQLRHDLDTKLKQAAEAELKIKLLRYQMDIAMEDLCVEMEVKPSFIRLTNSVQDRCIQLENMLEVKKLEKDRLEQVLQPAPRAQAPQIKQETFIKND